MLLAIVAALVLIGFFWAAFRKPKLVPRGVQNLGELAILGVRDQILRPSLGRRGDSYLPFLVSLFFFIYIMNVMELQPPQSLAGLLTGPVDRDNGRRQGKATAPTLGFPSASSHTAKNVR